MKTVVASLFLITVSIFALSGCETTETDNIAKAQKCLDEVPEANYPTAENCMQFVKDYDSQQANILKCSIKMTAGGLVESRIVNAYEAIKSQSSDSNKVAIYMSMLGLTDHAVAVEANNYCIASGVSGLIYISGIILAGTNLTQTWGIDPTADASTIASDLHTHLDPCLSSGTGCPSAAQLNEMGSTALTIANSYCASPSADKDACSAITDAVDSVGGDTSHLGDALMCYIGGKTYDTVGGTCI
jgi:hypothetical protein